MLFQAGVEDEELGVSQPRLQLFDPSLQLLQQRVGQRRERRPGVFQRRVTPAQQRPGPARLILAGRAGPRVLREDFLGGKLKGEQSHGVNTASCTAAAHQSIQTQLLIISLQKCADQ